MGDKKKAIVTIAYGHDRPFYEDYFLPSIRAYAKKYEYDFYCIDEPLDEITETNPRMKARQVQFQKFLACSQPWAADYDYLVWMDSDMVINVDQAPDVIEGIPEGKIGVVNERKLFKYEYANKVWARWRPDLPQTGEEYHGKNGFQYEFRDQIQSGLIVIQPKYHAGFLKKLYETYLTNMDCEHDQPVISYHAQKHNMVHWLDERFNMVWVLHRILLYPFLNNNEHQHLLREALKNFHDLSYIVHMAGHVDWDLLVTNT
jgi:hypothetical protein